MKQIPVSDLNTDNYTQIFHEDEPKFNAPHHFEIKSKSDGESRCLPFLNLGYEGRPFN